MEILKSDPMDFYNVKQSKTWRDTDEVVIYPSCKAIAHMERLYKYLTRGKDDKSKERKVKEMLKTTNINMEIRTELDHELLGEDVLVAISYIAYLHMGSLGADMFERRDE